MNELTQNQTFPLRLSRREPVKPEMKAVEDIYLPSCILSTALFSLLSNSLPPCPTALTIHSICPSLSLSSILKQQRL